jgi:hypothetical protein
MNAGADCEVRPLGTPEKQGGNRKLTRGRGVSLFPAL